MKNTKLLCAFLLLSSIGIMASESGGGGQEDASGSSLSPMSTSQVDSSADHSSEIKNKTLINMLVERIKKASGVDINKGEGLFVHHNMRKGRIYRIEVDSDDVFSLTEGQITFQTDPENSSSSWMPSRRTVAWGAGVLGTVAVATVAYCKFSGSRSGVNQSLSL